MLSIWKESSDKINQMIFLSIEYLDTGLNYANDEKHFEVQLFAGDLLKTANHEYYYISGGVKQVYDNSLDTRYLKNTYCIEAG